MQPGESNLDSSQAPEVNVPPNRRINQISSIILVALSLIALLTVLSGFAFPAQAREPDEGAAAHIFQLSVVALVPTVILFLMTADWKRLMRTARPLALASGILVAAFAALFYLEHYFQ